MRKKAVIKKTCRVKKPLRYRCAECGLAVTLERSCCCRQPFDITCCGELMRQGGRSRK
ncbi:MAG: hypothetical protein WC695_02595 [Candidatus Omnitrophota bacterium]